MGTTKSLSSRRPRNQEEEVMRVRVGFVALAALFSTVVLVAPGAGAGAGHDSAVLFTAAGLGCRGLVGAKASLEPVGSVKFIRDGRDMDVVLRLDHGRPDTSYSVSIAEVLSAGCLNLIPGGNLSTDESGSDANEVSATL